ncbi:alpha-galactosidase [Mucor ambiguus]|uniref:Alpha-galactosidase n=1 Tax=Mucor ambiguus TaxID=91626 RepID=A0A0C9N501_9FUNG|nr:alpha-galactosidase [Mucor ambiguus]
MHLFLVPTIRIPEYARKPVLGFSTWSSQLLDDIPGYGGKHVNPWFNEQQIKDISDTMREKMPSYEYINLDSGWCNSCDEYGRWNVRKDVFPNGLRPIADHLKKNGHKLGLYILPGIRQDGADNKKTIKGTTHTLDELVPSRKEGCGFKGTTFMPDEHNELVQKYYDSIADLFHEWGVSFIKLDAVGPGGGSEYYPFTAPDNRACTQMMYNAFKRYDIWLEISWQIDPAYADEWAQISNGARIYVDIESYSTKSMTSSHRIMQRITPCEKWADTCVVGSDYGFYIDLDVVLVGMTVNGKCVDGLDNDDVRQTCISFWAIVSSVFCIGSDPRAIPEKYLEWYNHKEILEIHQSGVMARPIGSGNVWQNRKQVWWKKLKDGRIYICLINAHTYIFMLGLSHEVTVNFQDIGDFKKAQLKDVWTGEHLGLYDDKYSIVLRAGQSQTLLLTPAA